MPAQEELPREPLFLCELADEENWERSPDGSIRISNLEPIDLRVKLLKRGLKVEPLVMADQSNPEDATVDIKVFDVGGEEPRAVPIKLSQLGSIGVRDRSELVLVLKIPVSDETWEAELEEFLIPAKEMLRKEGLLDAFERHTADPEVLRVVFRDQGTWNRHGRFEIQCSYKSDAEDVWNGELLAEPLILEIINDGTVFDKMLPPEEEP